MFWCDLRSSPLTKRTGWTSALALLLLLHWSTLAEAQQPPTASPDSGEDGSLNREEQAKVSAREDADLRFDPEIARRYRTILEQNPEMGTIYRKLVELYGRKSGVTDLLEEYKKLVQEKPDHFSHRMMLGHLFRTTNQDESAEVEYLEAAKLKTSSSLPYLAAGGLAEAGQRTERARELYELALQRMGSDEERKKTLERLADLAFRKRDLPEARRWLEAVLKQFPTDPHVLEQVARIYEQNGYLEEALEQWRNLLGRMKGNTPELVRILKEIGMLQLKLNQDREAEASFRRALGLVRTGNWNGPEINSRLVEIYRRRDQLRNLIEEFETTWNPKEYAALLMLGALHDEVGQEAEALRSYRLAAEARPREAEPRLKQIAIHQRRGHLDEVITEYKRLIAAIPGEFVYSLQLADVYWRRGDAKLATSVYESLARRGNHDPALLSALADAHLRNGQRDRALALTQRLVALEPDNEAHLINLGEQQFQLGQVDRALRTWRQILEVVPDPPRAWSIYGETLAAHDRVQEATQALQKAVQLAPDRMKYRKALALALRRSEQLEPARQLWQEILSQATTDKQRVEAREQIVGLSQELKELDDRIRGWQAEFERDLNQTESGFLWGLGLMKLKRYAQAEQVWLKLLERNPGNIEPLLALETCYSRQYKLEEAIKVLERVAPLVPLRSRELYQRMATYAVKLMRDDEAIRWATRAVALNPDDASAHARLAEIHYREQNLTAAVGEYQRALQLDPKDFQTYFQLATIFTDLGRSSEADRLYRQVLRLATDENDLRRAAKLAVQLNMALGTLESLERELLPLLFRVPSNPIFVRILVDLYEKMVKPLQLQVRYGRPEQVTTARGELTAISKRAAKPLLEALASKDDPLVAQAVDALALLGTSEAAVPLGHLLDAKEMPMRVRTAIALGHIAHPSSVPSLIRALEDPEREVREAACWALGRIATPVASQAVVELLKRKEPRSGVRAMALLALGRSRETTLVRPWILRGLGDAKELARAAAAWAAGRHPKDPELIRALIASLERDTTLVRQAAARSLGALGGPDATGALLLALWGDEPRLRETAALALLQPTHASSSLLEDSLGFVELETGKLMTQRLVVSLNRLPTLQETSTPSHSSLATIPRETLTKAIAQALSQPGHRRVACLQDLDATDEGLTLERLAPKALDRLSVQRLGEAVSAAVKILPDLHLDASPQPRALIISVLAKAGDPTAAPKVERALADPEPIVREAAAVAAGRLQLVHTVPVLGRLLNEDPAWNVRAAAANGLSRLAATGLQIAPLLQAAQDAHAIVRESSARALGTVRSPGKDAVKIQESLILLLNDPIPAVRAAAASSLGALRSKAATAPLRLLIADSSPEVRAAAQEALSQLGG